MSKRPPAAELHKQEPASKKAHIIDDETEEQPLQDAAAAGWCTAGKFDPLKFFAAVHNPEQKRVWETIGKGELTTAVAGAVGSAMIPDLQAMAVGQLEPKHFRSAFGWQLKRVAECTADEIAANRPANTVTEESDRDYGQRYYTEEEEAEEAAWNSDSTDDHDEEGEEATGSADEEEDEEAPKNKKKKEAASESTSGTLKLPNESLAAGVVSKVGGLPFLKSGEQWPTCPECGEDTPLRFLFQLLLSDMPNRLGEAFRLSDASVPLNEQLVRVFLHYDDEASCDCIYNEAHHIDLVHAPGGASAASAAVRPEGLYLYSERLVIGWTRHTDYPSRQDFAMWGLPLEIRVEGQECEVWDKHSPVRGEKLSGFPHFFQEGGVPTCGVDGCTHSMQMVFQIEGRTWNMQLGDSGTGIIWQCPKHAGKMQFFYSE